MAMEQIVYVPESGQLTIELSPDLKKQKRVKIIINEVEEDLESKITLMKKAPQDRDFMADLEEVTTDFSFIDSKIDE